MSFTASILVAMAYADQALVDLTRDIRPVIVLSHCVWYLTSRIDIALVEDAAVMAQQRLNSLPTASHKPQETIAQQEADPVIIEICSFCQKGWPAVVPQKFLLQQCWVYQPYLTIVDDILFFKDHIVIPTNMCMEMLHKLYESHIDVTKCCALAQTYSHNQPLKIPQANGEAEQAAQAVKNCLHKATDPYVAILIYHATPQHNDCAPSKIMMGRNYIQNRPPFRKFSNPRIMAFPLLFQKEHRYRDNQPENFNQRHATQPALELYAGDPVYINDLNKP
ncbi:Pol polyprotein [Plakobranchus ocellatus]|uniref:Pol polyprotein n=1 Tax=Plakobranchus ocellatus TaxID=259542 RepID=A0AAV4AC65_9GAST|nr:Pol polyprotein [Plakobranchus ocellatus]